MNKKLTERYYSQGFYNDKDLDIFVRAGFLTETEKEKMKGRKINGEDI